MQLDNKDRDQLLHILLQTRRLAKIALSTKAITCSEQQLILNELDQATSILRTTNPPTKETT